MIISDLIILYNTLLMFCMLYHNKIDEMNMAQRRWSVTHIQGSLCAKVIQGMYKRLVFRACHGESQKVDRILIHSDITIKSHKLPGEECCLEA